MKNILGDKSDLSNIYSKKEIIYIKNRIKRSERSFREKLNREIENEKKHFKEKIQDKHERKMKHISRVNN